MATLLDHRLVVHLFVPSADDDAIAALRDLHTAAATGLGLTEPGPLGPGDPDDDLPAGGVAAHRYAPGEATRELIWYVEHDVACLSVSLSRSPLPDAGWPELLQEWTSAVAAVGHPVPLGTAFLFQALASPDATAADVVEAVREQLPVLPHPGWPRSAATLSGTDPGGGVTLWQLDAPHSADPVARLVAVAVPDADPLLGELTWTGGWRDSDLPAVTLVLLNAAKLRHHARVLVRDRAGLRGQRRDAAATLADLRQRLAAPGQLSGRELADAQQRLDLLHTSASGLIDALLSARIMRRGVEIAAANLAELRTGLGSPGGLFTGYETNARLLHSQLEDEAEYLQAATERAQFFAGTAEREVARRADAATAERRRRHEVFTLTQTAFLGAVVMALTAVQSFDYKLSLPGPVKPAAVAVLAALAFWLAMVAVRQARHAGRPRVAALEVVAGALLGASAGWLAASVAGGGTTPTVVTAVAGAIGGTVAVLVAARRARHRPGGAD